MVFERHFRFTILCVKKTKLRNLRTILNGEEKNRSTRLGGRVIGYPLNPKARAEVCDVQCLHVSVNVSQVYTR